MRVDTVASQICLGGAHSTRRSIVSHALCRSLAICTALSLSIDRTLLIASSSAEVSSLSVAYGRDASKAEKVGFASRIPESRFTSGRVPKSSRGTLKSFKKKACFLRRLPPPSNCDSIEGNSDESAALEFALLSFSSGHCTCTLYSCITRVIPSLGKESLLDARKTPAITNFQRCATHEVPRNFAQEKKQEEKDSLGKRCLNGSCACLYHTEGGGDTALQSFR